MNTRRLLPRSLRTRLLVALLLVLLCVLGLWLAGNAAMLKRQQTGWLDSSLRMIAHQILQSLPDNADQHAGRQALRLPDAVAREPAVSRQPLHAQDKAFQVWTADGRLAFRSPGAPLQPFHPGFTDGLHDEQVEGQGWRVYSVRDAGGRVIVQVGRSQAQLHAELARWARLSLWTAALVFMLLAAAVWSVICWSLGPVKHVQEAIARRPALDFAPFATEHLPQELAPLVDSFNGLLQRLGVSVQGERRFLADAAHELRTPLAALLAQTELALTATDALQRRQALQRLRDGAQRSARVAEQLLDTARLEAAGQVEHQRPVWLYEIVEVAVRDFEQAARQRGQRIVLALDACEVRADVDLLGILLRNLVDNALRYGGDRCNVEVACSAGDGGVVLRVSDDGPGVPAADRERIFDRFHRLPGSRSRGSGVGLSLVARIAELHGACIEAGAARGGRGLSVSMVFPPLPPRDAGAAPPSTMAPSLARPPATSAS